MSTRCKACNAELQDHNTNYCTTCYHKQQALDDTTKGHIYIITNPAWPG